MKKASEIQANFILESKHQKQFLALLSGWKSAYVCHNLRTEKQGIYSK